MTNKLIDMVDFAKTCILHNFDPVDLAKLIELRQKCFNEGVKQCNGQKNRFEKVSAELEKFAKDTFNLVTKFPGLNAEFFKETGEEVRI